MSQMGHGLPCSPQPGAAGSLQQAAVLDGSRRDRVGP
jgi:hypothetical protein